MADSQPEDYLPTTVDTPTDTPASKAGTSPIVPRPTTESANSIAPSASPHHAPGVNANRSEHPTNMAEWLRSHYLSMNHSLTVEAYTKVTVTEGGDAWWEGSHINWALELVRNRYQEHEDVGIAIPHWCYLMYLAETVPDYMPADKESQDYISSWEPIVTDLGNKDIVILPVNDGFRGGAAVYAVHEEALKSANKAKQEVEKAQQAMERTDKEARESRDKAKKAHQEKGDQDQEKDQVEVDKEGADEQDLDKEAREAQRAVKKAQEALKKAKANEKEARKAQQYGHAAGSHWSFIVVDRRNREHPRAHYVDGMVRPQRRGNDRWAITNIDINGRVAGQILRGFDRLFELPEHGFEAHTLKFVPNMSTDNAYRDDGSCGPHLYAFLDHILGRKTTLIDPGLHTTFDDQSLRSLRAREFNFNSRTTRFKFAGELLAERKQHEARRPDLAVANLTREVLNDLTTVNGLIDLVASAKKAPSSKSGTKGVRPQGNAGGSNKDNDDDDDDDNPYFGDPPILKSILQIDINQNFGGTYTGMSLLDCYTLSYNTLRELQAQYDQNNNPDQCDPKTPDIYLGKHRYRNVPRDDTRIFPSVEADDKYTKPRNETTIPDFETVVPPTLKRWFNANFEKQDRPDYRSENWEVVCRARLHVMIKKSLLGQSDNNVGDLWSKDTAVFDPTNAEYADLRKEFEKKEDKRPMYGVMREMLMRHYMTKETVDELLEILKKFKVEGGNSGSAGNHTKPQDFQTIAKEPIDFLTMKDDIENLGQWMFKATVYIPGTLTLEENEGEMETRARLHRAYNGRFTHENASKEIAPTWRKRCNLGDNSMGYDHILEELNWHTHTVPKLTKRLEWYPDYYLMERNITPAEDSDEDTNEDDPGLIPTNTSNTISSKRKHEGDSDSAIKKYKKILKLLKMPVSEDDGSAKEDDAKNTELVNDNAEDTFDDVREEEDALGGIDAFVSSSSELSSLSEHSDD